MTVTATEQNLISADTLSNLYSAIDAKYGDNFFSAIALVDAGILDRAKWDAAKNEPGFNPVAFMNDDSNWVGTFADAVTNTDVAGEKLAAFKSDDNWKTGALNAVLGRNAEHLKGELKKAGLDVDFTTLDPAVQQQLLFIATTKGAQGAAKWLAKEQAKAPKTFDTATAVQGEIARLSARGRSVASNAPTLASVLGADAAPGTLAAKGGPGTGIPADYRAPVLTPGQIVADADTATLNAYANDPVPFSGARAIDLTGADPLVGNPALMTAKGGKEPDPAKVALSNAYLEYAKLVGQKKDLDTQIAGLEKAITDAKTSADIKKIKLSDIQALAIAARNNAGKLTYLAEDVIPNLSASATINVTEAGTVKPVTAAGLLAQAGAAAQQADQAQTKAEGLEPAYTAAKNTIEQAEAKAKQDKIDADLAAKTPEGRIKAANDKIAAARARAQKARSSIVTQCRNLASSTDTAAFDNNAENTKKAAAAAGKVKTDFDKLDADIKKANLKKPDEKKAEAYEALAEQAEAIAKAVEDANEAYANDIAGTKKDEEKTRIRAVGEVGYAGTEGAPEAARKLGQKGQLVGLDPLTGQKVLNQKVYSNQLEVIREQLRAIGAQLAAGMPVTADTLKPWKEALDRLSGLITVKAWQQTFREEDRGFLNGKKGMVQGLQNDIAAYEAEIAAKAAEAEAGKKTAPTAIEAKDLALSPADKAALIASMRDELDPKVAGKGNVKRFSDDRIPEAFIDKLLSADETDTATIAIRDSIFDRVRNAFAEKNKKLTGKEVNGRPTPSKQDIIDYANGEGRKLKETSLADDYIAYLEPKVRKAVEKDVYALATDKTGAEKDAFIAGNNATYQAAFVEAMKSAYANAAPENGAATAFAAKKPKGDPAPAPQNPNQNQNQNPQPQPSGPVVLTGRSTVDQVFPPATEASPYLVIDMGPDPMLIKAIPQLFQPVVAIP